MCIACNVTDAGYAEWFLEEMKRSRDAMKDTASAMLACSRKGVNPSITARYDQIHKKMVKLIREWNSLEHQREI